jgi:hypothetical protein
VSDPKIRESSTGEEAVDYAERDGDRNDVLGSGGVVSAFLTLAIDGGQQLAVGPKHLLQSTELLPIHSTGDEPP